MPFKLWGETEAVYRKRSGGECCGTCRYHQHEDVDDGWVCVNDESVFCTDWTDYNDWCGGWEARE